MGGNSSNSQGTNISSFNQSIPGFQQSALSQLYGTAANTAGQVGGALQSQIPGAQAYSSQVANSALPAYQQQLNGGAYGGLNIGNQLMSSLQQSQNSPTNTQSIYQSMMGGNGNSYLQPLKASMEQNQANAQALNSGQNAAQAAAAGMSGGSRQGVQDALMKTLGNQNLTQQENQMGYNTFNQDLNNKLGIANMADQNTLARQQLMSNMLGQQNSTQQNALGQSSAMQNLGMGSAAASMLPWQNMANYSNTIGSPNVLSNGMSIGNSSSKGGGGGILTS